MPKFMVIIKTDPASEAKGADTPNDEMLIEMGKYNEQLINAGVMVDGDGLQPTATGFRLENKGGKVRVIDGPFTEAKELVAGFWILDVASREEAIEWAKKCPFDPNGEGALEIRRIMGTEDFPVQENESGWREAEDALRAEQAAAPKKLADPGNRRYFMAFLADEKSEAGELPDEQLLTDMGNFIGEMAEKGIFLAGEGLAPSSEGARVYSSNGKIRVVDGPFAETKELISGYAIVQCGSREEAVELATRGALINGDGWSEIRPMWDTDDFEPLVESDEARAVLERERQYLAGERPTN